MHSKAHFSIHEWLNVYRETAFCLLKEGKVKKESVRRGVIDIWAKYVMAMLTLEIGNLRAVEEMLRKAGRSVSPAARRGMDRIAKAVVKKAVEYAPRSPTRTIASRTLKVQRRSKSQRTPGDLEKSIKHEVCSTGSDTDAVVFVAANAPAGKYAARIHDQKGVSWFKRGPGTVAKGTQADEKFIARAIKDTSHYFDLILEQELNKGIKQ